MPRRSPLRSGARRCGRLRPAPRGHGARVGYGSAVSVTVTVLVYALIPLGALALLALATLVPGMGKRPRYRSGQPWEYAAVWWSANPGGVGTSHHAGAPQLTSSADASTVGGGARGTW